MKIVISGTPGEGKSTVAAHLRSMLFKAGIECVVVDDDVVPTRYGPLHRINNNDLFVVIETKHRKTKTKKPRTYHKS